MSRRRLERGYWNGRQVGITDKEHDRLYVQRPDRHNRYYIRFGVTMHMDWPFPTSFDLDHRLPRKTLKALWKSSNGHPDQFPKKGVVQYNHGWAHLTDLTPGLIHNGRKPR